MLSVRLTYTILFHRLPRVTIYKKTNHQISVNKHNYQSRCAFRAKNQQTSYTKRCECAYQNANLQTKNARARIKVINKFTSRKINHRCDISRDETRKHLSFIPYTHSVSLTHTSRHPFPIHQERYAHKFVSKTYTQKQTHIHIHIMRRARWRISGFVSEVSLLSKSGRIKK